MGELEGVSVKGTLMLLILARERTDRFLSVGAISKGEEEETFLDSLRFFLRQLRRKVGWGDLAIQVGLHANDLNREAKTILEQAQMSRVKAGSE